MRAHRLPIALVCALVGSLVSSLVSAPAFAQTAPPCGADLPGAQRVESARYVIAWRADPQKIPLGRHFAIDMVACARPGAAAATGITVDATMPAHGHGMNYKPSIKATGDNRWRAEGLMFHMPGQWELAFDVRGADKPERAKQAVTVR